MENNQNKISFFKKLLNFQSEAPNISKGQKNKFGNYDYADLADIRTVIRPLLRKHEIGYYHRIEGEKLFTYLFDPDTGFEIESDITIPTVDLKGQNAFQQLGSGITYLRRYALLAMLGLSAGEDDDAASAETLTRTPKKVEHKPAPTPTPKPTVTLKQKAEAVKKKLISLEKSALSNSIITILQALQKEDANAFGGAINNIYTRFVGLGKAPDSEFEAILSDLLAELNL